MSVNFKHRNPFVFPSTEPINDSGTETFLFQLGDSLSQSFQRIYDDLNYTFNSSAFMAHNNNVDVTLPQFSSGLKISFSTTEYDLNSCFSNSGFKAKVQGVYFFCYHSSVSQGNYKAMLYKNGVKEKSSDYPLISCLLNLNIGDVVEVYLTNPTNTSISIEGDKERNFFCGARIG